VAEGLSGVEAGKELEKHAKHTGVHDGSDRRDRIISITEALLLSIVTIVAAWSGYSAAKWGTASSLELAKASATRAKANRAYQQALTFRVADATTFNAWFTARIAGNVDGARVAEKRFRPDYRVAFDAWLARLPFSNPDAPPGPQDMPQYKPTGEAASERLDAQADADYSEAQHAAKTGDNYIRTTVILASVLFLVGISSHFPIRAARLCLTILGAALLVFAAVLILQLPAPP
jgi:hypothetical protein